MRGVEGNRLGQVIHLVLTLLDRVMIVVDRQATIRVTLGSLLTLLHCSL